jgi:hypothetical protein
LIPRTETGSLGTVGARFDGGGNLLLVGAISADRQPPNYEPPPGDYLTLKIAPTGSVLWARVRDGAGGNDYAMEVGVDGLDNVVVTGVSVEAGSYGVRTLSYDPAGVERWSHFHPLGPVEDTYPPAPALAVSVDGVSRIATSKWNGTDFDAQVLHLDRNGALSSTWSLPGDPPGDDYLWGLTTTVDGATLVSGQIWGEKTLRDGLLVRFPGPPPVPPTPRRYNTLVPCRLLDTRESLPGSPPSPLTAGNALTITVVGSCGIPPTAQALALNVTVTGATAPGNLRVFAGGALPTSTSTANYLPGQTRANNAIATLGRGGRLGLLASQASGKLDVIVDVSGYFE